MSRVQIDLLRICAALVGFIVGSAACIGVVTVLGLKAPNVETFAGLMSIPVMWLSWLLQSWAQDWAERRQPPEQ